MQEKNEYSKSETDWTFLTDLQRLSINQFEGQITANGLRWFLT